MKKGRRLYPNLWRRRWRMELSSTYPSTLSRGQSLERMPRSGMLQCPKVYLTAGWYVSTDFVMYNNTFYASENYMCLTFFTGTQCTGFTSRLVWIENNNDKQRTFYLYKQRLKLDVTYYVGNIMSPRIFVVGDQAVCPLLLGWQLKSLYH